MLYVNQATKISLGLLTSAVRTIKLCDITTLFGIFLKTNKNLIRVADQYSLYNNAMWHHNIGIFLKTNKIIIRIVDQCSMYNQAM